VDAAQVQNRIVPVKPTHVSADARRPMTDPRSSESPDALHAIKLLHTVVWAVFAGSIVAIPLLALAGAFRWASILALLVLLEVLVLLFNGMRCPLTAVAARHTDDRRDNFDIYLPEWLARWNKHVFGTLYVVGLLVLWATWTGRAG
jgi:hypothetical protein